MRIYFMDTKKVSNAYELLRSCLLIKDADLIVVTNNTILTHDSALAIFFGMSLKRPIIMHNGPSFARNTYLFLRETISKRLSKILLANVEQLDSTDAENLFATAGAMPVNYTLTRHETVLGRSYLLSRLRETA